MNTAVADTSPVLAQLQSLGSASGLVDVLLQSLGHSRFFEDFTLDNISILAQSMRVYRAEAGQTVIREGDTDDYMLFVLEGLIDIVKADPPGEYRSMSRVGAGATLGEMSMIDGEPRFASCIALEPSVIAVFSRESMVRIIMEEPALGAKILIKLVTLLSQRLRETSVALLTQLNSSHTV